MSVEDRLVSLIGYFQDGNPMRDFKIAATCSLTGMIATAAISYGIATQRIERSGEQGYAQAVCDIYRKANPNPREYAKVIDGPNGRAVTCLLQQEENVPQLAGN